MEVDPQDQVAQLLEHEQARHRPAEREDQVPHDEPTESRTEPKEARALQHAKVDLTWPIDPVQRDPELTIDSEHAIAAEQFGRIAEIVLDYVAPGQRIADIPHRQM